MADDDLLAELDDMLGDSSSADAPVSPSADVDIGADFDLDLGDDALGDIEAALKAKGARRIAVNDPPNCVDVPRVLAKELAAEGEYRGM